MLLKMEYTRYDLASYKNFSEMRADRDALGE